MTLIRSLGGILQQSPPAGLADAILALSPIGYWKLNETSGTTAADLSGNGYDGTYTGTYTLADVAGPAGGSFVTLGGGRIVVSDQAAFSLDTASGMTVFAIVRPTTFQTNRSILVSKGAAAAYEWQFTMGLATSSNPQKISATVFTPPGDQLSTGSGSVDVFSLNTWTVAAARVGGVARNQDWDIYVNDSTELSTSIFSTTSTAYANGTASLVIGHRGDTPASQNVLGAMAHVAVFAGEIDVSSLFTAAAAEGWY
jgi:hypothetical protein